LQYPTPFPYQQQFATELSKRERVLFSGDMGVGKTCIAATAANLAGCARILIICPASLQANWKREVSIDMWMVLADITIVSFNKAGRSKTHRELSKVDWDLVIVDEAHYLKNHKSKRTAAIYDPTAGIASKAKRLWLLSGTFTPNNASELWTHLRAVAPETVSQHFWDFRKYYCAFEERVIGRNSDGTKRKIYKVKGNRNVGELNQILDKVAIRCKAKDVLPDLPPIYFERVFIESKSVDDAETIKFKLWSDGLLRQMVKLLELLEAGKYEEAHRYSNGLNLDQISRAMRFLSIEKAQPTVDYVKELLNSTDKIVVIGKHRDSLNIISNGLSSSGIPTVKVDGTTSMSKRNRWIDEFQRDEDPRVFIGQVHACGVGVTLTRSNHVVFAEQSWVPADNIQAAKRCHRIGQDRTVFAHVLTIPDSLDELVQRILILKQTMIDQYNL
jgi:SWI/SNF-related matrix-associated actin-dependent regulator 1 of chromatin subfamily A